MCEIIPSQLWIGNAGDVADPKALYDAGVAAILHLVSSTAPATLGRDFVYCRIPLVDGAENPSERLRFVIETGVSLVKSNVPTLIACSAGMSRSPSIAAAVLSVIERKSPDEMLTELLDGAPADVSPGLWESVKHVVQTIQNERT